MVPLQYILNARHLDSALTCGCHWVQLADASSLTDAELKEALARCHAAGCYLVLTDAVKACQAIAADGVLLTAEGICTAVSQVPEPSGIVLQRPRPITLAIGEVRRTLGEESPQFVGVVAETPDDAVAAAKAGADFIQVPVENCQTLVETVRTRSFTTPIVALGTICPDDVPSLLDDGINGIACCLDEVPPLMASLLLTADEQQ